LKERKKRSRLRKGNYYIIHWNSALSSLGLHNLTCFFSMCTVNFVKITFASSCKVSTSAILDSSGMYLNTC
jgi:hypothetical protein